MKVVILHNYVEEIEPGVFDQAEDISNVLSKLGYEPIMIPFSTDVNKTVQSLQEIKPSFVFNLVEFFGGKDQFSHIAPLLLDYLKIPYTGCPTEGIFLTSNKIIAKRIMRAHNIPTPEWATVGDANNATNSDKPFIIKSVWGHGSSIISEDSVVALSDKKQLEKELKDRFKSFDDYFFAENYIDGREFTIPLLSKNGRPEVLPLGEMQFLNYPKDKLKIIEYKTKWVEDSFEYNNSYRKFDVSDADKPLIKQLKKIAIKCWNIFKLNGYARIDVRVDNSGNPFVLDINTNPYIASGINSSFIASAEEMGLTYEDVIKRIIGHLVYSRRRHHLI